MYIFVTFIEVTMLQFFKSIVVISSALALSGCLDMDQQVTLDKNELTYKAELKIDAKIAAFADKKDKSLCDGFGENSHEGIQFEAKESTANGNVICTIIAKGKPEKFSNFSSGDKDKSEMVKITKIDKNIYKIESEINFNAKNDMQGMEGMLEAMLAGRNITWAVTAPKIIETNGKLSSDKKSVSWSIPLSVAFKNPQNFYAVVQEETSWYDSIIGFFLKIVEAIKGLFTSSPKPVSEVIVHQAKSAEPVTASVQSTSEKSNADLVPSTSPSQTMITSAEPTAKNQPVDAQPTNPFTPSFDCSKASNGQERLICSDRELSKLDVDLSNAYASARQRASDPQALRSAQREWIKSVQKSCSDKECLTSAYKNRIAELQR